MMRASRAELLEGVFADWAEGDQRQPDVLLDRLLISLLATPTSTPKNTPTSLSRERS